MLQLKFYNKWQISEWWKFQLIIKTLKSDKQYNVLTLLIALIINFSIYAEIT